MRAGLILLLMGCSTGAHIDLRFKLQTTNECADPAPGNPPAPTTCDQLTLGCADHLLLRVRNEMNDIINSKCIELKDPMPDLCALEELNDPVSLIDSVPNGTRFVFQLAALHYQPLTESCDDESNPPLRVLSGKSDPVLVDGNSHLLTMMLTSCSSCSYLPGGQASDLGAVFHDLNAPASDLGTASDFGSSEDGGGGFPDLNAPVDLAHVNDLATMCVDYSGIGGGSCCPAPTGICLKPGTQCAGGGTALLPPGGCCAVCG